MRVPGFVRRIARLGIRSKLAIAFLGLSGVPLALVGWYAADAHLASLSRSATERQRRDLAVVREKVQALLTTIGQDMYLLAESRALTSFLDASAVAGGGGSSPNPVEVAFEDFLRSGRYHRLRLLGRGGVELAHVTWSDGGERIVPPGRWRGTGYRFYRTLLDGLPSEGIAFAPVELQGGDDVETPPAGRVTGVAGNPGAVGSPSRSPQPIAVFSFARALGDDVILVADVDARLIFEALQPAEEQLDYTLALVDGEGHYLYHSLQKNDWNTLLATEASHTLQHDLPEGVVREVLSGASGVDAEAPDSVVAFSPLFDRPYPALGSYSLISIVPKDVLFSPVSDVRRVIFGAGAMTILIAGLLALIAAHQFAAPIRALTREAAELARGRFQTRLDIHTGDEIEDLAASLSSMAAALAEREEAMLRQEEQLRRHSEDLEEMVAERTRELERSHEKLIQQEKMAALGRLAAGVAHELGTPLATITCHSEMIAEDVNAVAEHLPGGSRADLHTLDPHFEVVLGEAERCRGIVRDLLELARPGGREVERLSISAVIRKTASLVEHDLKNRGIELRLRLPDDEPMISGNENQLVQVFINLLLNASDAMPSGGTASVSLRYGDQLAAGAAPHEQVGGDATQGAVVIEVEDDGEGIDLEIQGRVFEPFFTTKDPGVGTGLGLWMAYNTIVEHGGTVECASSPGVGTRFTITLPEAAAAPSASPDVRAGD